MERLSGTQKLVKALRELNDPHLDSFIVICESCYYDEYKGPLNFPLIDLIDALERLGLHDLATRTRAGEFDAEAWEGDEWWATEGRQFFLNDPELRDAVREIGVPIDDLIRGT